MLLVVRPGAPSSFLLLVVRMLLVVRPGAPSSFLLLVVRMRLVVMATSRTSFSSDTETAGSLVEPERRLRRAGAFADSGPFSSVPSGAVRGGAESCCKSGSLQLPRGAPFEARPFATCSFLLLQVKRFPRKLLALFVASCY